MARSKLMMPVGDFGELIDQQVRELDGYVNAHAHLDRSGTLGNEYLHHCGLTALEATDSTLKQKQNLTGELHKGEAYRGEDLAGRIGYFLNEMAEQGVKEVTSFIDVTPDVEMEVIDAATAVGEKFAGRIKLKLAAHPIFGFKVRERIDLFVRACADPRISVVGALPEKDDRPDSIGFREHLRMALQLGIEHHKEVHVHTDQGNDPTEEQTFAVLKAVYGLGSPQIKGQSAPTVWVIHAISPSAYQEERFGQLLREIKDLNVGVICCPRAGISMRQNRSILSPTHNCIARVLEMAYLGIPVRLGTDNIADMFVPTGSGSVLNEVLILADIIRFYRTQVLAKIAAGVSLNESDKEIIRRHLIEYEKALRRSDPSFRLCVPLD